MKEILFLENPAAYTQFLAEKIPQGQIILDSFIGVGTLSTHIIENQGLSVNAAPHFFAKEFSNGIIQGNYSAFKQETLLFHSPIPFEIPISRWIFTSLHLSIFQLTKQEIKTALGSLDFLKSRNIADVLQILMEHLFTKIQEMRAQSIFIFFDVKMYSDYIKTFLLWIASCIHSEELKNHLVHLKEAELQKKVTHEFLWYLAECALHPSIVIYPATQHCFEDFISATRYLKRHTHFSDQIVFKSFV